jgi:hypothetical protein
MKKITITRIFCIIFVLSFIGLGSCKKEEPDVCSTNWYSALSSKISAVANTAMAYGLNQTTANCQAYKTACQAYLTALQPYANCTVWTGTTKADWQEAINDTQAEINSLTCN